jgi:enterochelin esterase family protein
MREVANTLKSANLGNERTVWVQTPDANEPPAALIVFLDGEFYREHIDAPAITMALMESKKIPSALTVYVSIESMESRWRECPSYPPFARFVADELLPWLTIEYPIVTDLKTRVLVGFSYTGLAASFVVLQAPNAFTHVISQSGSYWWNDCWLVDQFTRLPSPLPVSFYLEVGSSETQENVRHREDVLQVVSQIEGVQRFRNALHARAHRVHYSEFDGGHDFAAWKQTLPGALRWAFQEPLKQS